MCIVFIFNRFLGTTPDSSTIGPLLKSLILQIRKIYGQETGLSGEVSLQLSLPLHIFKCISCDMTSCD